MTENAFLETYKPIKNQFNPEASWDGCLYDTHGQEGEFVRSEDNKYIWTLASEGDDDYITNGYHLFNRIGYFIATVAHDGDTLTIDAGGAIPEEGESKCSSCGQIEYDEDLSDSGLCEACECHPSRLS